MSRGTPSTVGARRGEVAGRLAGADGLFVGLDFDGTLAPITADPGEPTITPPCRQALERLASRRDTSVAVISGRALSDLRGRVGVDGIVYAGNHGLELDRGGGAVVHPAAARHRPALQHLLARLAQRLRDIPGVEIEDKALSGTVHVRRTPAERVGEVEAVLQTAVDAAEAPLSLNPGKQVFEIRPNVEWDKGSAVQLLTACTPDGWPPVYLGDDVTDEDAFRTVRPDGLGILVGPPRETDAAYRLPNQSAVAPFLDWLVDRPLEGTPTTSS